MKIRTGFVSNSSSSSFVCEVCGHEACGYDMGLRDCDMCQCTQEHIMCTEHLTKEDFIGGEVKEESCPVCGLKELSNMTILCYLFAKHKWSHKEIENEIRTSFKTLKEVNDYIVKNRLYED